MSEYQQFLLFIFSMFVFGALAFKFTWMFPLVISLALAAIPWCIYFNS